MVIDGIEMICRVNDDKSYRYWFPPTQQYLSHKQLKYKFGISLQEWFDTYVLKLAHAEDRPKCKVCGKPAKMVKCLQRRLYEYLWQ